MVEVVTLFRDGDSITYLANDYLRLGDKAEPLKVVQSPYKNEPFVKFKLSEAEGIMKSHELRPLTQPNKPIN